ncbi:MAG: carboxypeptidase-like regulatory domain-containing protein [Bryobacteraceae bacterium]
MKWAAVPVLFSAAALAMAQQTAPAEPSVIPPSAAPGPAIRTIEGTVLDRNGRPVPGAIVLIKNTKTLGVRSYIAQQDGKFYFYGLSTDINYGLRAESNGMTSKTRTVNVFNSHKIVHLKLRLNRKKKT